VFPDFEAAKSAEAPAGVRSEPVLSYLSPLRADLAQLNETVAGIRADLDSHGPDHEGSVVSRRRGPGVGSGMARASDMDLRQITDNVYRLLERRIAAERERRGL
jgi:hypothetical protein